MPQQEAKLKSFRDIVIFENDLVMMKIPEIFISRVDPGSSTLDVKSLTRFITNATAAASISNFINGVNGQEIKILGDGFTTVSNNSSIKTNTGANKLLAANKVYTFTLFSDVWYESE